MPPGPLHRLTVLTHGNWLPLSGDPREEGPQAETASFYSSYHISLASQTNLGKTWEGTTRGVSARRWKLQGATLEAASPTFQG